MDADRVHSYLQVACAGLGFDIGEVWWMNNESGTSTVAAIEDRSSGHESDSSGEGTYDALMRGNGSGGGGKGARKRTPKKRFLQLYTSKAYCNQRSKLVQPHDSGEGEGSKSSGSDKHQAPPSPGRAAQQQQQQQLSLRRTSSAASLELDEEHVLSPRIVEAVMKSTQVVWANCQKTEGLLGRSDIKLQTAIGMPVGVDESGNVWVVVMFSPKNVESSADAIDYLQYISRSAASTSIPCLLPVVGDVPPEQMASTRMICNGDATSDDDEDRQQKQQQQHHSLVSIKPKTRQPDHTQELGDGVTAKFVSFNINDDDEGGINQGGGDPHLGGNHAPDNDLRDAPKDDWGIPMLPDSSELGHHHSGSNGAAAQHQNQLSLDAIDNAITDAFDEASYGVWSTIMNSAGGDHAGGGGGGGGADDAAAIQAASEAAAAKMHLIQERLEEFATAFLGMSVFDVADAWTCTHDDPARPVLKCLFTVSATDGTSPDINALMDATAGASINVADGAVGKAYSSGYPVWSSVKELIYDGSRKQALESAKIETAFAVPIFSSGDVSPSCVLSCYSLLPAESVPFVLNFVQKAVRLLWSGLDRVVNPHESVGRELWKDVGPADLGEMAADVEMQKAFIGKKRPRGTSFASDAASQRVRGFSVVGEGGDNSRRSSAVWANEFLPSLAPAPAEQPHVAGGFAATAPPPARGLAPAPLLPNTVVQELSPHAQQFVFLDSGDDGHWAVQQAVQSVGDHQLWSGGVNGEVGNVLGGGNQYDNNYAAPAAVQQQPPAPLQPMQQPLPQHHIQQRTQQYQMAYVDYGSTNGTAAATTASAPAASHIQPQDVPYPPAGVHADDPEVIRANLMEFNAMAQMHSTNNASGGNPLTPPAAAAPAQMNDVYNGNNGMHGASAVLPNQHPMTNGNHTINLDKMVVIPISQAEGSVILTGPQQSMYCTSTAQPLNTYSMDPSFFDVEQKPCRIEGCTGFAVSKRPYCARHCGNRQCEKQGCNKCAQGATRFCIAHGGGRRCTFPGCDKGARDKYFCAAHGGGKRCKREGCSKSAVGGSNFCTGHGGGKRCQVPGCDKSAQSSTKFCVKHGGGKKCQHHGCEKVARGKTLYCAAHGGGVRCKLEGCNRVAIGKAQLCRAHGGGVNSRFNQDFGAAI